MLFRSLRLLKHLENDSIIISHSLRATVIIKILKLLVKKDIKLNTTIHQVPMLTDTRQRIRRFIYSQFTDKLFGFSKSVVETWDIQFSMPLAPLIKFSSKKIVLLRNGIYLKRMTNFPSSSKILEKRMIFLGRPAFWKGLEILKSLMDEPKLSDFKLLLLIPEYSQDLEKIFLKKYRGRAEIIYGRSPGDIMFNQGDVHIYPANFGPSVKNFEAISINCLEMASLGIPSVVTRGGAQTWSDLIQRGLVIENNWSEIDESIQNIIKASEIKFKQNEILKVREVLDISHQIDYYLGS